MTPSDVLLLFAVAFLAFCAGLAVESWVTPDCALCALRRREALERGFNNMGAVESLCARCAQDLTHPSYTDDEGRWFCSYCAPPVEEAQRERWPGAQV